MRVCVCAIELQCHHSNLPGSITELAASEARTRDFGGGGVGDLARCDERCAGRATTGANNGWRFLGGSLVGTNFSHGAHPSDHYGVWGVQGVSGNGGG